MKRILIVEDILETQNWLAEIAAQAFPDSVVEARTTVHDGMEAVTGTEYQLALIDLGLPDGSGLEVLRAIKASGTNTLCVITTVLGDDAHVVAALSAGAQGYLLKEQPADVLTRQLNQLTSGIPALSPSIARRIMEHFQFTGPAANPEDELTNREREVLALIGRGLRNADVSTHLEIAESTVATHIKAIYRKLGISSRAEAAWHSVQLGLSTSEN